MENDAWRSDAVGRESMMAATRERAIDGIDSGDKTALTKLLQSNTVRLKSA